MLKLYCPEIDVIAQAESVESAYIKINNHNPELVLLDIQMPDGTGFDLLRKFENINFKFVFITAYQEHAIKAFVTNQYTANLI